MGGRPKAPRVGNGFGKGFAANVGLIGRFGAVGEHAQPLTQTQGFRSAGQGFGQHARAHTLNARTPRRQRHRAKGLNGVGLAREQGRGERVDHLIEHVQTLGGVLRVLQRVELRLQTFGQPSQMVGVLEWIQSAAIEPSKRVKRILHSLPSVQISPFSSVKK